MVLDPERVVEEDHHAVAGEMLKRPSVRRDQLAEGGVVVAQDVEQLLGRGRLRERGEAAQVEEETCDVGAVARQELLAVPARDQLGHLGREEAGELSPLPLDGLEQARVRERDRGLVGEGLEELDVLLGECLRLAAHDDDGADELVLDHHRHAEHRPVGARPGIGVLGIELDRKSTRLNSSHTVISYAVFCLKKKKKKEKAIKQKEKRRKKY